MATQYRPRIEDPTYFTRERVVRLTDEIRQKVETCVPSQSFQVSFEDTLNWMQRVWRPHASYAYMDMMTVKVMMNHILQEYQQYINNNHAVLYQAEPRID